MRTRGSALPPPRCGSGIARHVRRATWRRRRENNVHGAHGGHLVCSCFRPQQLGAPKSHATAQRGHEGGPGWSHEKELTTPHSLHLVAAAASQDTLTVLARMSKALLTTCLPLLYGRVVIALSNAPLVTVLVRAQLELTSDFLSAGAISRVLPRLLLSRRFWREDRPLRTQVSRHDHQEVPQASNGSQQPPEPPPHARPPRPSS